MSPKIDNWSIVLIIDNPYSAPECGFVTLHGFVTNHPDHEDKYLQTSELLHFDLKSKTAKTKSRFYRLGDPSKKFLRYLKDRGFSIEDYEKIYRSDN
jgi:hypothetical protein